MSETKSESQAVTTTHVCHWNINVTAIVIVVFVVGLVVVFWKYIPGLMARISKNQS
ncbi:MAG: hypothetical protein O8C61_03250 [Candidatus Methanoperedens sp.]|nr:hypothetical protein [Candidatus Methanoperedens sp.]